MAIEVLVPLRRWQGIRVLLPDLPHEAEERRLRELESIEAFDAEEAAWTPFLPEFFDPEVRAKQGR